MDYIEIIKSGKPIEKVFKTVRKTPYLGLFIVSTGKREALLHYSEEKIAFYSEWYDHIDNFENFIYAKVYSSSKFNFIYETGKLVSPYWSDEMKRMGVTIWPICFNEKINFIKNDGSLLLNEFSDCISIDEVNNDSFYVKYGSYCISKTGEFIKVPHDAKYEQMSIDDIYTSTRNLSCQLKVCRHLFDLSIENASGKPLISECKRIIRYPEIWSIPFESNPGILFSIKKDIGNKTAKNILQYEFATLLCADGYKILCFTTESIINGTFDEVQVSWALVITVRKGNVWNIIDRYGDYISKNMWFDNIEIFSKGDYIKVQKDSVWNIIDKYGDFISQNLWFDNIELQDSGNAIVKKDGKFNILKSNGTILSQEWYDYITVPQVDPYYQTGQYIVKKGNSYNIIDNNLRISTPNWLLIPDEAHLDAENRKITLPPYKDFPKLQVYEPLWWNKDDARIICYIISCNKNELSLMWHDIKSNSIEATEATITDYVWPNIITTVGDLQTF